jgi:hypothetical protein
MLSSAHQAPQICKEATMAEITFNTADQDELVREEVKAAVAAYREMLDTFVGNRTRPAAAGAEPLRPRQLPPRK